jgi:succinate-acetate transporter protein
MRGALNTKEQAMSADAAPVTGRAETRPEPPVAEAPAAVFWHGNPAALGLPCFIAGSVVLGLALVGVVPLTALGAAVPIILTATSIGLFLATIWAASLGQTAVASVFGIFAGFWLSYAVLSLGLNHNWFAIPLTSVRATFELFLVAWLVVMVMLTLATLRLPLAFTGVFVLVDVALVLLFAGFNAIPTSTGLLKAAGWVILVFAAIGVYLYADCVSQATGGGSFPLGKPALHMSRGREHRVPAPRQG